MIPEQSKANRAWRLAKAVAEMAYIYQSELEKHQSSPDLEELIFDMEQLLEKNEEKWLKSLSQILEVKAVESLTQIFKGIASGEIFKEMTEEQIQMKIWQLRSHADDPDYFNFHEAIKWPLPTKEEIAEKRGPKEYALWFWEDYHKARTTIISYGRKIKSGELRFTPLRQMKPLLERKEFISSVFTKLLEIKTEDFSLFEELSDQKNE